MNLVDTSGWLEFFFDGPLAKVFSAPIEKTSDLVVPIICLYEVFKKINQVADEAKALQIIAQMKQGRIVEINEEISLRAALISLNHKLPMADSIIYATTLCENAVLWTKDEHFKNLPSVKCFAQPKNQRG